MNPAKLPDILERLAKSGFWGEVVIRFKDGRPCSLQKNEQIKLDNPQEDPSRENHRAFHAPQRSGHGNRNKDPGT